MEQKEQGIKGHQRIAERLIDLVEIPVFAHRSEHHNRRENRQHVAIKRVKRRIGWSRNRQRDAQEKNKYAKMVRSAPRFKE